MSPLVSIGSDEQSFRRGKSNAAFGLILAGTAIFEALIPGVGAAQDGRIAEACFALVSAPLLLLLGIRIATIRVNANAEEVVVSNVSRTYKLQWHEIERFEMSQKEPWIVGPVGVALLRDGRRISMIAIQDPPFGSHHFSSKAIASLNRLHRRGGTEARSLGSSLPPRESGSPSPS